MNDTEFNSLWRSVASDHAPGIDASSTNITDTAGEMHNASVRALLREIKERMDRLTEPAPAAPDALRELLAEARDQIRSDHHNCTDKDCSAIRLAVEIDAALGTRKEGGG